MIAKSESSAFKVEVKAVMALCRGIDTPRSLTVYLHLKNGMYKELLALETDPLHYRDAASFGRDYLVTSVLKKNPRLPIDIDRKAVALASFKDAERLCESTNRRLSALVTGVACPADAARITSIQGIIQRILGVAPSRRDLEYAESKMRFGPGATTSVKGVVTRGRKYSSRVLDCTPALVSFRAFAFPHGWREHAKDLRLVDGSQLTTVPKNAKTDRCICIEPDLNIFVQLGIGSLLKSRLKAFGLDLSTQEPNRNAALRGVADGLATIDLSSASDTISSEVVRLLLPPKWVELLEFARCPITTLPSGEKVRLEKWSSMGNGYTFELESLIFYAAALSEVGIEDWGKVRTFGDDIIVPSQYFSPLVETLNFLGFKVNTEKSFGTGLFRESCGVDTFDGVNVRPTYFRSDLHGVSHDHALFSMANRLSELSARPYLGDRLLPAWTILVRESRSKVFIPPGFGDVGFIGSPPCKEQLDDGWEGYRFKTLPLRVRHSVISQEGALVGALSEGSGSFTLGREALRGRYVGCRTEWGYSLEWPRLGSWM